MLDDIDTHIIGITESRPNKYISNAELGLTEYEEREGSYFIY